MGMRMNGDEGGGGGLRISSFTCYCGARGRNPTGCGGKFKLMVCVYLDFCGNRDDDGCGGRRRCSWRQNVTAGEEG